MKKPIAPCVYIWGSCRSPMSFYSSGDNQESYILYRFLGCVTHRNPELLPYSLPSTSTAIRALEKHRSLHCTLSEIGTQTLRGTDEPSGGRPRQMIENHFLETAATALAWVRRTFLRPRGGLLKVAAVASRSVSRGDCDFARLVLSPNSNGPAVPPCTASTSRSSPSLPPSRLT